MEFVLVQVVFFYFLVKHNVFDSQLLHLIEETARAMG